MGLFRRMDYMGLKEEITQLGDLLPELSNREDLPSIMHEIVQNKHRGIHSKKGIFTYTDKEAEQWKQSFSRFNGDMYILSDKYTEQKRLKIIKENHK
jgi:3-hydroxybutyryl-CoA dehydrogenase